MKLSLALGFALILSGCSAITPWSEPPLASRETIAAAEAAELADMAADAHWNDPFIPFQVIGNIYYVGTSGVAIGLLVAKIGYAPFFILIGGLDLIGAALLWMLVKPKPIVEEAGV